jgi:hypothetical protein
LDTITLAGVYECVTDAAIEKSPLHFCRIKLTYCDEHEPQFAKVVRMASTHRKIRKLSHL